MAAKYITIAREIKKRIISQQYAANEPLPDQFALAAEFSSSRMTIQQAMRQLIVEGLVYTRQGRARSSAKTSFSSRSGISPAATTLVRPKPGNIWER
jgi:GntR family transcriptional regulator